MGQVRTLRSPGLLVAIAAVCIALPAVAVGAPDGPLAVAAPAANSTTYTDSTGEDPAGPDISTIVVSNNDAGLISFRINVPNRPAFDRDMLIDLLVDTDNNPATGDPDSFGADYAIEIFLGEAALFRWDGTNYTRRPGDPPFTSLLFSYQGGITITISAAELGNTSALRFGVTVISGVVIDETTGNLDFANAKADFAPAVAAGLYPYAVKIGRPTLVVRRFAKVPARPAAGKAFALKLAAVRSDTGAPIRGGRVTCVGRVEKSSLRAKSGRFVGNEAVCTWQIPAGAKGKTFRGTVTIVFEGLKSTRSFSGRIR